MRTRKNSVFEHFSPSGKIRQRNSDDDGDDDDDDGDELLLRNT